MTFFNLVHFFPKQANGSPSRRWLGPIGLFAVLLLPLSMQSLAQGPDWGQWVEPRAGSDKGIPPGIEYDGGKPLCEGMQLSGKHAYWRCFPRCGGRSGAWCWEGVSDAIYSCPAPAKGFRRMEKIRYTNVPCGKKDWLTTKGLAEDYGEVWQTKIDDPPEVYTVPPPTTEAELPPQTGDKPPQWDGGGPPWKEATKTDTPDADKTGTGKTDTGKTDTPKTDTSKTDTGKTANTEPGQTATDKKETSTDKKVTGGGSSTTPSTTKKSATRKEVRNKNGGRTVDRSRNGDDYDDGGGVSPDAAAAIGIGIGMGLGGGFGGRGHMGGGDRRMDR
jgi:hypothetical protein